MIFQPNTGRTCAPLPDRIDFRDGATADSEDARMCLTGWHPGDGLQVGEECRTAWRKLKGAERLAQVIKGVNFKDGLQEEAQRIAA